MLKGTVVSLCDLTGNMVKPWAKKGFKCVCYDIMHSIRADRTEGNITYRWGDVRSLLASELEDPLIIFAFPPCTHGSVSGARDFKRKGLRYLIDWLETFERCREICEMPGCPWMIEQPIVDSVIHRRWREPDFQFDPCDYGDPYTKKTNIWCGNGFIMPPKNRIEPTEGSKMHLLPPSENRANERSETPIGFAKAVFRANYKEFI